MILGYEQPVDIPMMSMYDKDMMKMYLGALQRDYEQGIADQKEFNKTFGDFYSPSSVDMQNWYNMTQKPIQEFLERNPNAIRSVEGRAQLRTLMNSIPYADLAKLKQSAENQKQFNAAKAKIIASGGQILPGQADPSNWNTLDPSKGVFSDTTPIQLQSLNQYTSYLFDNLKDSDLGPNPNNPMYRMTGVTEEQMRPIVDYSMNDLLASPLGQFYYDSAKRELQQNGINDPTDKQIRDQFANDVITANKERIHVTDELDDIQKMNYQYKLNQKLQSQKAADAQKLARLKAQLANEGGINNPSYNYILDNATNNIATVYGNKIGGLIYNGLQKGDGTALAQYQAAMLEANDGKGSVYRQSLHLAGKEDVSGFYARLGILDTGSLSSGSTEGSTKDGGTSVRSGVSRSKGINSGVLVGNDINMVRNLRTIRDVSTLAYGSRRINTAKIRYTTNGNSMSVSMALTKGGANVNTPMHKAIESITPVGGDKNIIYQINNDGTYHAYRKVNVKLKNNNPTNNKNKITIHNLWYDYGEVEWRDDAAKATTRRFKSNLGVTDLQKKQTLVNDYDFED